MLVWGVWCVWCVWFESTIGTKYLLKQKKLAMIVMIRFDYDSKGNKHEEVKYDLYTQRFYYNGYKSIETKPVSEDLLPLNDCNHIVGTTDKPVKVQFVKYDKEGSFFIINGESRVIPNNSNWRSCQTGRVWR